MQVVGRMHLPLTQERREPQMGWEQSVLSLQLVVQLLGSMQRFSQQSLRVPQAVAVQSVSLAHAMGQILPEQTLLTQEVLAPQGEILHWASEVQVVGQTEGSTQDWLTQEVFVPQGVTWQSALELQVRGQEVEEHLPPMQARRVPQ